MGMTPQTTSESEDLPGVDLGFQSGREEELGRDFQKWNFIPSNTRIFHSFWHFCSHLQISQPLAKTHRHANFF